MMKKLTAILGPTNTGKTHLAIERMLAHGSGMIGLPLRLLAREIYDKCRHLRPDRHFALITGEEKILPKGAEYFICTTESMPADRDVEFMAIDEIQLCSDPERGHIFTDRLLHWRGSKETLLLGSETIKPLLTSLVRDIAISSRPRLSKLSYSGIKKISRLPRRTAIIAFNAENIYAIAELVRRQKGGAAVVMGSLSPRTRNAQVALFQSGDVPYLVATDAIGMGLNMDIDHVAFANTRKFDGRKHRDLRPAEIGQIAGRAGRYLNDGTFGTTADARPLDDEQIRCVEDHVFEPDKILYWRNTALDFSSIPGLKKSLLKKADKDFLHLPLGCTDSAALENLSRQGEITKVCAAHPANLRLLWEVCQIPDYRNISPQEHCTLLETIFFYLAGEKGTIPEDWLSQEVNYADRSEGDIDTLANRLAHIRTWTYVSHRHSWLEDSRHWQEKTRAIEDKLSDALHQKLMARFIDRKTSLLMKRLRQREDVRVSFMADGNIVVENEVLGAIKGFQFKLDHSGSQKEGKELKSASSEIISEELAKRAENFLSEEPSTLALGEGKNLLWQGEPVASLSPGDGPLTMKAEFICDDLLAADLKDKISAKIQAWLDVHLKEVLEPLFALSAAEDVDGLARGVAFQIIEARGILARDKVASDIKALDQDARAQLRKYGVRFGAFHIYMPVLLKPAPAKLLLLFWTLVNDVSDIPTPPPNGLTSLTADPSLPEGFYTALGYKICGSRAARVDMLERLGDMIREVIFWKGETATDERPLGSVEGGGFSITPDMMSLLGCSGDEFTEILKALGYRPIKKKVPGTDQDDAQTVRTVQAGSEDISEQKAEDAAKELEIEVWLPAKKPGGRAQPRKKTSHSHKKRKPGAGDRKKTGPKKTQKPIRPEDSPFAALLALKNQQTETS